MSKGLGAPRLRVQSSFSRLRSAVFAHPFVPSRCQRITWKQNRQARRVTARAKRTVLCRLHPAPRRAPSPADAFCAKRAATGGLCKAPSLPGGLPRPPPESHQTKGPHLDALRCRVPLAGGGPCARSWPSGFTWSSGGGVLAGRTGSFLPFLALGSKLAAAAPEPNPCACCARTRWDERRHLGCVCGPHHKGNIWLRCHRLLLFPSPIDTRNLLLFWSLHAGCGKWHFFGVSLIANLLHFTIPRL